MGHKVPLEVFAEGGFVNDRSGKATEKIREDLKGKEVEVPGPAPTPPRKGNPILKKFKP